MHKKLQTVLNLSSAINGSRTGCKNVNVFHASKKQEKQTQLCYAEMTPNTIQYTEIPIYFQTVIKRTFIYLNYYSFSLNSSGLVQLTSKKKKKLNFQTPSIC